MEAYFANLLAYRVTGSELVLEFGQTSLTGRMMGVRKQKFRISTFGL